MAVLRGSVRRIYAANAAVRRLAKVWGACGLGMPRKAGANALRHLFDKFLEDVFKMVKKRQDHCNPDGANTQDVFGGGLENGRKPCKAGASNGECCLAARWFVVVLMLMPEK